VNPLYEEAGRAAAGTVYRRRFPSDVFRRDNAPVADFLPEHVMVSDAARHALGEGLRTEEVGDLVASCVVLAMPGEPWLRR
jgi:hypothetical protein